MGVWMDKCSDGESLMVLVVTHVIETTIGVLLALLVPLALLLLTMMTIGVHLHLRDVLLTVLQGLALLLPDGTEQLKNLIWLMGKWMENSLVVT